MRLISTLVLAALATASSSFASSSFYWANPRPIGSELGGVDFESPTVGYAVGAFGTAARTTDGGVAWEVLTTLSATAPDLDDVLVLSPGALLAAGDAPGLHRSTDGGATWSPVTNPASVRLRNLFALDASTIFAVGDLGRVTRSTDGGTSWTSLTTLPSNQLVDQWWLDALTGYVIGQNCVRRTTDGGTTWSTIPNVTETNVFFPGDIQFTDSLNGLILTDFDTFRTTNGGTTWAKLPAPFGQFPIYQEEAIVLGPQTRLVATEAEGANIWKTTNDGSTWTNVFDHAGTRGVTDLERLPNGEIVAVTTDGDFLRSTNGGASWSNFTNVAGPPARANTEVLDVHSSGLGFAGGYGSIWIQTTDFGRTWFNPATNPNLGSVQAITIRDASFVLAGGSGTAGHSDVRRSTDGGATWTVHDLAASYVGYPVGLAAFEDGTCFCATYGGTNINRVYRSTDNGTTWHLRSNGVSNRLFDLFFLDSQRGFVCGGDFSNPTIFRTTDGGGQWTPVGESGLTGSELRDTYWLDDSVGFVVNGYNLFRTTNGGGSWENMGGAGEAVDFLDAMHGVASGWPNSALLTSDGGATWTPMSIPIPGYIADAAMVPTGFLVCSSSNSIVGFDTGLGPVAIPEIASAPGDEARLVVWPNPLRIGETSALSFRVDGAVNAALEARLYDVAGRLLARSPLEATARTGSLPLLSTKLMPGVVFLQIRSVDGSTTSSKVAVIR